MAMPEHTLLFMAAFATLCSIGAFLRMDHVTQAVVGFLGSIVWAMVGLSSTNVAVGETGEQTTAIMPMFVLGMGAALLVGAVSIRRVLQAIQSDVEETQATDDMLLGK